MKALCGMMWGVMLLAVAATGCDRDHCDAGELREALERASAGDTVRVGACRVEGSFVVRQGVTLEGTDPERSVLVAEGDGLALRLAPEVAGVIGDPGTWVRDLTVETDGRVGVLATGQGAVTLERVTIRATRGVGLAAEDLTALSLDEVTLEGPVTAGNADELPADPDPLDTATHGLLLVGVGSVSMTDVTTTGFAEFGALIIESGLEWRGGGAPGNSATGLMVHGGRATLEGLDLCGTLNSFHRLIPSYAGVFAAGAEVETTGLEVCDGENYGLLHDSAAVVHQNVSAHGNGLNALWVQRCPSFELSGTETLITDNGFAGVVVFESEVVTVVDAQIDSSRWGVRTFGEMGSVRMADGIQVVSPTGPVLLDGLSLAANERVGLLLDLDDAPESLVVDEVEVSGSGEQYGALAQGAGVPAGWDEGVTRLGDTGDNDADAEVQQIVGSVPPDDTPEDAALLVFDEGIAGVIGDPGSL